MFAPRTVLYAQRAIRIGGSRVAARRFASGNASGAGSGAASGAVTGGLIGGGVSLLAGYAFYQFSGAKDAVSTAQQAKGYVNKAYNTVNAQLPEKAPSGGEAIQIIRDTANKYAAFIPGGKQYVDSAFRDVDEIRKQHGEEVDKIVHEAYGELYEASKKGFSIEAVTEIVTVLQKYTSRVSSLAGDAANDILSNHPELKEKLGGSADQLKSLAGRLGPEAKQQLNNVLKQGNVSEVVDKVRSAISSGNVGDLEKYLKQFTGKGSQQLSQWLEGLPEGGQVLKHFQSLQELASSKGKEAEELLKETVKEIKQILDNKLKKADKIRKDAQDRA